MEGLPAELTMDILSRLPVKTIVHCKCVCKKWKNLVSDSFFVNLHISKSPTTGLIIHLNPDVDSSDRWNVFKDLGILKWVEIEDKVDHHHLHHHPLMTFHLNLPPIFHNYHIYQVGSVNGLICLWQYSPKIDNAYICNPKLDNTYICNPITREIMILPRPRYLKQSYAVISYGFGVNSVTGEYKVVRVFQSHDSDLSRPSVLEAEVYTLGTCQWRSLGPAPYWPNGLYGPFLNNHCHWIVCDEEDVPEKICTFDLDTETFQLFPSPPESVQENQFHHQSLAVVKGCLCKLDTYDSESTIWVMKEYGIKKSWHKEVVFKKGVGFHITWLIRIPMYLIEGLEDGSILILSHNNKLLAYCPKSDTIEDTKILDSCKSVLTYCPSFLKLQNFESENVQMF